MTESKSEVPPFPVRKSTLIRVIEDTEKAAVGSRHVLATLITRRWKTEEFIGSLALGLFFGEMMELVDSHDFELIHARVRNRDILPIVDIDQE